MKSLKTISALAVILLGVTASESALAQHGGHHGGYHGGHARFGVFVGVQAFWYYPPPYSPYSPYYYDPPVATVPYSPPVYIERGEALAAPEPSQAYWYYCADTSAYYPYVRQCPGGWQRVVPQPPPG